MEVLRFIYGQRFWRAACLEEEPFDTEETEGSEGGPSVTDLGHAKAAVLHSLTCPDCASSEPRRLTQDFFKLQFGPQFNPNWVRRLAQIALERRFKGIESKYQTNSGALHFDLLDRPPFEGFPEELGDFILIKSRREPVRVLQLAKKRDELLIVPFARDPVEGEIHGLGLRVADAQAGDGDELHPRQSPPRGAGGRR